MALFVYARHTTDCPKKSDRFWKRCRCPKWIRGVLAGVPVRESASTRSWNKAEDKRRLLENEADEAAKARRECEWPKPKHEAVTIADAIARFLASKRNENLAESTIEKLVTIFEKQFLTWAHSAGYRHIDELSTAHLEGFRDTWKDGALAKKKKQERLVGFFYYCIRSTRISAVSEQAVSHAVSGGPCVIVGRGSQYFLRERNDVFRVFLYASRNYKIHRLISQGTPQEEAIREFDTIDRDRAVFVKTHFKLNWPERNLYHAMFNTETGDSFVAETIVRSVLVSDDIRTKEFRALDDRKFVPD